jgi:hypothetical protein
MTDQNGIDLSKLSSVTFPKETRRKNGISKNDVSKTNDDILHLSSATIQKLLQKRRSETTTLGFTCVTASLCSDPAYPWSDFQQTARAGGRLRPPPT